MSFSRLIDFGVLVLVAWAAALAALGWRAQWPSRRARVAWWALVGVWAVAWLACTPAVTHALVRGLEPPPVDLATLDDPSLRARTAIVVLSSSVAPPVRGEALAESLDPEGVARTMGAARVWRRLQSAAVIVTGTGPDGLPRDATARAMAELLVTQGVPRERVVLEVEARNTRENARYSVAVARARGLARLVVVTSALHMPRSLREFRRAGVEALGVPVHHIARATPGGQSWLPTAWSFGLTHAAVHEYLGMLKP